jgi:hypothetical protein
VTDQFGTVDVLERVEPAAPTAKDLEEYTGKYVSDEAETTLDVVVDERGLAIKRRPDTVLRATPAYADAFTVESLGLVIFRRDAEGRVNALSVSQDRVWDLRFTRSSPQLSSP